MADTWRDDPTGSGARATAGGRQRALPALRPRGRRPTLPRQVTASVVTSSYVDPAPRKVDRAVAHHFQFSGDTSNYVAEAKQEGLIP